MFKGLSEETIKTLQELNPKPKEILPEIYNVDFVLPSFELTASLDPETFGPYDPWEELRKTPYYPKPRPKPTIDVEFRAKRRVGKILLNVERTSETNDGQIVTKKVAPATFLRDLKRLDSKRKRGDLIDNLSMSQKLLQQPHPEESKMKTIRQWHVDLSKTKKPEVEDETRYRVLPVDLRSTTLSSSIKRNVVEREEREEIARLARADYTHMKTSDGKVVIEQKEDLLPVRTIVRRAWDYVKASLPRGTTKTLRRKGEEVHDWAVGLNFEIRKNVTSAAMRLLEKEIKTKGMNPNRAQRYRIELLMTLRADHIAADETMSSPKRKVHDIQWKSMKKLVNHRMESVLGSGMWTDPVASTLTKPLDSRVLAPTWNSTGKMIQESMLVPEAARAIRTIQKLARSWQYRRYHAARSVQRSLRGFLVRLGRLRERREAQDIAERNRRRRKERETRDRRERHAATRIQSAARSRWERNDTRSGKKMSHLRYERALRLLRRRLVTRLKRKRAVRTLIRWWRYRIRVLRFASSVSIQYVEVILFLATFCVSSRVQI